MGDHRHGRARRRRAGRRRRGRLHTIGAHDWLLAALTGLLVYALPFWLFMVAWTRLPASTVSPLLCGEAPVAIVAGTVLRHERYGSAQWIGAAIGILAMLGVSRAATACTAENEHLNQR